LEGLIAESFIELGVLQEIAGAWKMALNNFSPNSVTPRKTKVLRVSHSVLPVTGDSEKYLRS